MAQFIESIKLLDGVFYRLPLHQQRVNYVFETFLKDSPLPDLQQLLYSSNFPKAGLFKCRIVFSTSIELIEFLPYTFKTFRSLKLVDADIEPCKYKSVDRTLLDNAYAKRDVADDILIVNRGFISDTWFANVALWNGKEWHTPKTALIAGVQRAELMAQGRILPTDISPAMLCQYQQICIFNAMMEFGEVIISINSVIE